MNVIENVVYDGMAFGSGISGKWAAKNFASFTGSFKYDAVYSYKKVIKPGLKN